MARISFLLISLLLVLAACGSPAAQEAPAEFQIESISAFCIDGSTAGLRLSWTAAERVQQYVVHRSGTPIAELGAGTTSFSDVAELAPGSEVEYVIVASNAGGQTETNPESVTVPAELCETPPAPVGSLTAQVTCEAGPVILLSWTAVGQATSYVLERDLEVIADLPASATSQQDMDVSPGDSFRYVLRAVNDFGLTISAPLQVAVPFDICTRPSRILSSYRNTNFMIAEDGSLWAWGDNDSHQLGLGHDGDQLLPVRVPGVPGAVAVSAGNWHVLMLDSQGRVWAWGDNDYGQIGVGHGIDEQILPVLVPGLPRIIDIAAGHELSLALDEDGVIWSWGYDSDGETGHSQSGTSVYEPLAIDSPIEFRQIEAGTSAAYAIDQAGNLYAWGTNFTGQLGHGDFLPRDQPVQVSGLADVVQVAAGNGYALVRHMDGSVHVFGRGSLLGLGPAALNSSIPVLNTFLAGAVHLAAGEQHAMAILPDGRLLAWGENDYGQVGDFPASDIYSPTAIPGLSDLVLAAAGEDHSVALTRTGSFYAWGHNDDNQLGWNLPPVRTSFARIPLEAEVVSVAARSHGLAIDGADNVWAWGDNEYGQLGTGSTVDSTVPVRVPGLSNIIQVVAGENFSLALDSSGAIWSWGQNNSGQLGHGDTVDRPTPERILGMTGVSQLVAGYQHVLAVEGLGNVVAWGSGASGQLGNGGTTSHSPVSVTLPATAASIGAGSAFSAVVLTDGRVFTFGSRSLGALGDGGATSGESLAPVEALLTSDVGRIATGDYFNIAWNPGSDAATWAWGNNSSGQLATGDTVSSSTPQLVTSIPDIAYLSLGSNHSMAINSAGQLTSWGYNYYGQLGLGDRRFRTTPRVVPLPGPAEFIAAGRNTSFVVVDGELYGAGDDEDGQLGLGRLLETPQPRLIEDLPRPALYD